MIIASEKQIISSGFEFNFLNLYQLSVYKIQKKFIKDISDLEEMLKAN